MKVQDVDIVIAGGGLSGALMALSLADLQNVQGQKLSIAIIEKHGTGSHSSAQLSIQDATQDATQKKRPISSFDSRVLALSYNTAEYFKSLGIWQSLSSHAQAIEKIHISDRGFYGKARLNAQDYGVPALGYVAEMANIGLSFFALLAKKHNVRWFAPDKIADIHWQADFVEVNLKSAQRLKAKLLIACDGAQSFCREKANIKSTQSDYQQSALITNISTKLPHQNCAYERFTETGPLALLPLPPFAGKTRSSIVWTLSAELADNMQKLDDKSFKKALEKAFGSWLGEITEVGQRVVYPLALVQAEQQVYHRLALVGNASHTIHPIAGQGFNLGVRDVMQLAELVKQRFCDEINAHQQDIGQLSLLSAYEKQRKTDQQQIIQLTDSLVTLFSNHLPPLIVGRNIGLKVLNYLQPLKKRLVTKTMGFNDK